MRAYEAAAAAAAHRCQLVSPTTGLLALPRQRLRRTRKNSYIVPGASFPLGNSRRSAHAPRASLLRTRHRALSERPNIDLSYSYSADSDVNEHVREQSGFARGARCSAAKGLLSSPSRGRQRRCRPRSVVTRRDRGLPPAPFLSVVELQPLRSKHTHPRNCGHSLRRLPTQPVTYRLPRPGGHSSERLADVRRIVRPLARLLQSVDAVARVQPPGRSIV